MSLDVVYRESALRMLLPITLLLRIFSTFRTYSDTSDLPKPFAPLWVSLSFTIIPLIFSFYFLAKQKMDWAGICFILHWYLIDMLSLPAEGYWYPGFQISLILQIVLGTLFLPSRVILPFMFFQLTTVGIWGSWLDIHYYDPPLLSSGQPVAVFRITILTLAAQETIIVLIVRYLRLQMEKSLRIQQVTIDQLQKEIIERRLAEERLREFEERYRSLLENIPAITYLTAAGREPLNPTQYVSPQISKVSSHTSTEFLNDPLLWTKMIHPDDLERVTAESEHGDLTGETIISDYRIINKDNKISWIHDENVLVKDDRGKPLYRVGVWTDITQRKQAELLLQQLEDMYRRAIDAAGAVPYIISHDGPYAFTFIGEGILQMTGYPASEMTSSLWDSLIEEGFPRGKLAHLTYEEADRITNNDSSILWECDYRIRTRDGQIRWVADTSVKGVDEKSGHPVSIGIYQDITERKLAEEMQAKLIKELELRNAELERFAYTLSHELKSPLITIRGFMGYLREDAFNGNTKRFEADLQRITAGSDKMLRLIHELIELMEVGRISHEPEEFSLHAMVNEAITLIHDKIAEGNISVHIADDLPFIYGDRRRLLEAFQNLLENSAKFMGGRSGSRIEIGCQNEPGNNPIFYIRDNGIGIEPEFHERIFGIFQKLDANSEGTGIGLALVKRIIEEHGGRIWVESEGLGKGSTFYFTIPDTRK
jgi:PAS domain S-box-containing protein